MKTSPGLSSGLVMGALFLIASVAVYFIAPDFSGFYERVEAESRMPIWALLLGFSLVNFAYALISYFIEKRKHTLISENHDNLQETEEFPSENQDN